MNSLRISSPAKINLYLKILGRRKDGYHELDTLFHRISLADSITLTKISSGIQLRSNISSLSGSTNLIWKAHSLIEQKLKRKFPVSVYLKKQIPIGAGLGGGSSNAAHFLLGLKKLYEISISKKKLAEIGLALGADVNFFLAQTRQARGRGIGEKLTPIPTPKKLWFVLVSFPKHLPTRKVYQMYAQQAGTRSLHSLTKERRVVKLPHNDLQPVSIMLYRPINKVLELFDEFGAQTALVSGSGPTVFAVAKDKKDAIRLARKLKKRFRTYKKIFISHTI